MAGTGPGGSSLEAGLDPSRGPSHCVQGAANILELPLTAGVSEQSPRSGEGPTW